MPEEKKSNKKWNSKTTNLELLELLKDEIIRVGLQDNPSRTELQKVYDKNNIPHPNTYINKFGKWENIMKIIGFEYDPSKIISQNSISTNSGKKHAATWSNMNDEEIIGAAMDRIKKYDIQTVKEYMEIKDDDAPTLPTLKKLVGLKWSDLKRMYDRRDGSILSSWGEYTDEQLLDIITEEMHRINTVKISEFKEKRDKKNSPSRETLTKRGYTWKDIKEHYYMKYGEGQK